MHGAHCCFLTDNDSDAESSEDEPAPKKRTPSKSQRSSENVYRSTSGVEQLGGKPRTLNQVKEAMAKKSKDKAQVTEKKRKTPEKPKSPLETPPATAEEQEEGKNGTPKIVFFVNALTIALPSIFLKLAGCLDVKFVISLIYISDMMCISW